MGTIKNLFLAVWMLKKLHMTNPETFLIGVFLLHSATICSSHHMWCCVYWQCVSTLTYFRPKEEGCVSSHTHPMAVISPSQFKGWFCRFYISWCTNRASFGGKGYILVYTIYQPEATLRPLSSELNNINHIVTLHSYTGEVFSWELCGRYVGTCAPLLNIGANQVITHLHTTAAFWDHTRTLTQKQCDPAHWPGMTWGTHDTDLTEHLQDVSEQTQSKEAHLTTTGPNRSTVPMPDTTGHPSS